MGQVGLIGLGTMGRGLAQALASAGLQVHAYEPLQDSQKNSVSDISLVENLEEIVAVLTPPRRVLMMITAGDPVDMIIDQLKPLLSEGDIVLDGGNSKFHDTDRRFLSFAAQSIYYLGVGISGGEQGAQEGASIMVGGNEDAFVLTRDIFESIAAKADDGRRCYAYLGPGGAGHFIKMVHNGIEYAVLQVIAEAWHLLRGLAGLKNAEIAKVFLEWNNANCGAYLLENAALVLKTRDIEGGELLLDLIDDAAAQTGTGRWLVAEAMELGVPVPCIAEAVAARSLSSWKGAREVLQTPRENTIEMEDEGLVAAIGDALLGSIVCAYAQGFAMISQARTKFSWPVNGNTVARIWRNGCIIQSRLLDTIGGAYDLNPDLAILLQDKTLSEITDAADEGWRDTVAAAALAGLPAPAMASALAYFDALKSPRLWTALTQGQRDLFGAHTYRRIDRVGNFHTDWLAEC